MKDATFIYDKERKHSKKSEKYFFIYFDGIDESMNLCKVFTKKKAKMYFFFR